MTFAFKFSYCKDSILNEVESQQGKKRAGLSFELSVVCDAQTIHLISLVIMEVYDLMHQFIT